MLARVSTGAQGIASYLETGRKKGREFERDLIDERITLDGDLEITDAIIDGIKTAQDGDSRYLHITLGFSEDFTYAEDCSDNEVNFQKMKAVTQVYRDALLSAYDPSEYAFYAEAHIPKVTHEINESTGEYHKRLPHVHIVIPMRNLESGKYLNPFGYGKATMDYAEAIQEKINADFKLKSPQASKRAEPMAEHPLAKHNDQFSEQTPKQLREAIQKLVISGEVQSFDALVKVAQSYGEVKIRQGKEGDYINIKPSWAEKGINLKELTSSTFNVNLGQPKTSIEPSKDYDAIVQYWTRRAALEARYITSGNRKIYKTLDEAGKTELLSRKQAETRQRLTPPKEHINDRPDYTKQQTIDLLHNVGVLQSNFAKIRRKGAPRPIASLRNLPRLDLVHKRDYAAMLLQSNAPDRMGSRSHAGTHLRWARAFDSRTIGEGDIKEPKTLSVAGALKKLETPIKVDADKLKNETSPTMVLTDAVKRFGIELEDYVITNAKDGTPRIRHKDKHYNLGDFYTKHLGIPWEQAQRILTECHNATLSNNIPAPDQSLWKSFTVWRDRDYREATEKKNAIRLKLRTELVAVRNQYKALKLNSKKHAAADRQAILAKGRAEQIIKAAELKRLDQEAIEEAKRPSRNTLYRQFLNQLAGQGNLNALEELRRIAPPDTGRGDTISGHKSKTVLPLPSYKVDYSGKVTYFKDETAVVTDSVNGVSVVNAEPNAYDIALKVAVARYGKDLTFNGDQLFMKNMLAAARNSGMDLVIRNADKPREAPVIIQKQVKNVSR